MNECISVIVPIYNVEKYLSECIESILHQTYKNLEIILVDDGSPDGCGKICDEYEKKDNRIKVNHKKNGGLGDARNKGIKAATGEYLFFVDSDDVLEYLILEKLHDALFQMKAQVAICGFQYIDHLGVKKDKCSATDKLFLASGKEIQKRYFGTYNDSMIYTVAWNKLYRKELFQNIEYPSGVLHEDEFLTLRLLYPAEIIAVIPYIGYLYRMRDESIMDCFDARRFQLFDAYLARLQFYEEKNEKELWTRTFQLYLHMFEQYVEWQREKESKSDKEVIKKYRNKLKKFHQNSKYRVTGKLLIEYEMSVRLPEFYHLIWKIMK